MEPIYDKPYGQHSGREALEKFARDVQRYLVGKSLYGMEVLAGKVFLQFGEDMLLKVSINRGTQPVSLSLELLEKCGGSAGTRSHDPGLN